MKKVLGFASAFFIVFYTSGKLSANDNQREVWVNPLRYDIVALKGTHPDWAAGINVILIDHETGRTWTLKSTKLIEGWVPMPREEEPAK